MKTSTSPWEIKNCIWAKWVLEEKETKKRGKSKQSESYVHGTMLILIKVTQRLSAWEQNWINNLIFKKNWIVFEKKIPTFEFCQILTNKKILTTNF